MGNFKVTIYFADRGVRDFSLQLAITAVQSGRWHDAKANGNSSRVRHGIESFNTVQNELAVVLCTVIHVYVNDDLTTQRSKLVRILKGEKEIKSVWTIEGRINCTFDRDGHEVRKVIESPDDLFKLGWTEAKIAGLGPYADV